MQVDNNKNAPVKFATLLKFISLSFEYQHLNINSKRIEITGYWPCILISVNLNLKSKCKMKA